jgi:hypothetical protein
MTDFFRTAVNEDTFIRGAARLMWAGITVSFPTSISQIVNLSTYDAMTNWYDLGATKGGVAISRNSTEETFDVDQILANIDTRPVTWDQTIATAMAEASLDRINIAWEAGVEVYIRWRRNNGCWRSNCLQAETTRRSSTQG